MNEKTIVVAGNATLDVLVQSQIQHDDKEIELTDSGSGYSVKFRVLDPPITPGHKHRVEHRIDIEVSRLWHKIAPGGGGVNSALGIKKLHDFGFDANIKYIDVSNQDSRIKDTLLEHGINEIEFFERRAVPYNLVVGGRRDKVVLKGPVLGVYEPRKHDHDIINRFFRNIDGLLINSPKDPRYVEAYLERVLPEKVPVYSVITTSLTMRDKDFVFQKLVPQSRAIMNFDELPEIYGLKEKLSEDDKLKFAAEKLQELRKSVSHTNPLIITLGRHGVYVGKKQSWYHIHIKPDVAELIGLASSAKPESSNGAGDVFAGAFTYYDVMHFERERQRSSKDLVELAVRSSEAAIRHMGYHRALPRDAFEINKSEFSHVCQLH
jgi:sugar/nucleoside kinase (ribokinase family)